MSDGTVTSYGYSTGFWGDMLTDYNGTTITYDSIGNPLNWRNATALSWEKRELQKVTFSANSYVQYEYNSDGIRLSKSYINPSNYYREDRDYVLDGTKIIKEHIYVSTLAGITNTDIYYIYDGSGSVIGMHYNGTPYYFQKNLQGDVIRIVNSVGTVVVEYTYDAWGNVISTSGSLATTIGKYNPFRYRSYYYDVETGWYYLNTRYYDPEVGRFINADDVQYLGENGDFVNYNLFAYCENNPTNRFDENGNWSLLATIGVAVGAVLCVAAISVLTCGVGTATLAGAIAVGAAKGALIGATAGTIIGAGIGYGTTGTLEGALEGAAIGFGAGSLIGAVAGGISGGASFISKTAASDPIKIAMKKLDASGLRPGQTQISRSRVMDLVDNFDKFKANSSVYSDGVNRYIVDGHHTTIANTILGNGTCINMGTATTQLPSATNVYWVKKWYEFGKTVIDIID